MNSIESWSPSQSEPLTVSYMCQSQLSSLMLPSEALTPPWAATVCERVGNTLESTATDKPAWANCSEQRMPAPPAPTSTTSNWRRGKDLLTAVTAYRLQIIFAKKTTDATSHRAVSTCNSKRMPSGLT